MNDAVTRGIINTKKNLDLVGLKRSRAKREKLADELVTSKKKTTSTKPVKRNIPCKRVVTSGIDGIDFVEMHQLSTNKGCRYFYTVFGNTGRSDY